MNLQSWAFTVKWNCIFDNRPHVHEERYEPWLKLCKKHGITINKICYEKDSTDLLHIHGIFNIPKSFWMRKLYLPGYHTNFEKIYNEAGWIKYCEKDQLPNGEGGPLAFVFDTSLHGNELQVSNEHDDIQYDDFHCIVDLKPKALKKQYKAPPKIS